MGPWFFCAVSLLWGSSFLLMKKAGLSFGPLSIGGWRVVLGAIALLLLWPSQKEKWPGFRSVRLKMIALVLLGYCWPFAVQPWLINRHGSALMGMMIGLVPLFTVIVSVPMLRTRPGRFQTLGVLGGLGFLLLLSRDAIGVQHVPPMEMLLTASVPLAYAIANTWIKRDFSHIHPMAFTIVTLSMTGLLMLPLGLAIEPVQTEALAQAALALLILGALSSGVATWMFYWLIHRKGPLYAGLVTYVIPVVALAWGWLDGEPVTLLQALCIVGILGMVALAQSDRQKPEATQPTG